MAQQQQRGKKREREREDMQPLNGSSTNAAQPNGVHPAPIINARAGNSAARPRPVKKQRVVGHDQVLLTFLTLVRI